MEPITIKWAIDSPFDKSEALRAQEEIEELQTQSRRPNRINKNKKATYLVTEKPKEDPLQNVSIADRLKMAPEDILPQLNNTSSHFVNPALKKREQKIIEKDQRRERLYQLAT